MGRWNILDHPKVTTLFVSGNLGKEDGNYFEARIMDAINAKCSHLFLVFLELEEIEEDMLNRFTNWKQILHTHEIKIDFIVPEEGTRCVLAPLMIENIPIYSSIEQALRTPTMLFH
jgi:hypothetical protein